MRLKHGRNTNILALLLCLLSAPLAAAPAATAATGLPRPVARAFLEQHIPLTAVSAYVQEIGSTAPAFTQQPTKPMNPASTMKLLTTFAGLDLLGPGFRWKTEVYADGPIASGVLDGNLIIKGYGDPKITLEQFQDLVVRLRATGLASIRGDLVLDRSFFAPAPHDPSAFDAEPLKPYNVGPDALLVSFKSVRFVFTPNVDGDKVDIRTEPNIGTVTVRGAPRLVSGDCNDWRADLHATFDNHNTSADATFGGHYPVACGERDWYVALLDHPHFVLGAFTRAWADVGGSITGGVRDGRVLPGAVPLVTLDSAPLYDVVRDINKLSNNVMARQLFLTLATTTKPPPATTAGARTEIEHWLASRKLNFPELVLENGSGLSRHERISAQSMARLLLAADASTVRADYESSLAVAAQDGTVKKRFVNDQVADQAFLKTGTLDGVRAIAGYVLGPAGKRYVMVCFVNHPNAARAQYALDLLVQWVYDSGSTSRR
jgi:serine-type D-Ala-D-Ala carboxypeptidase/endopeptidase (penicillin-binding protein 4)